MNAVRMIHSISQYYNSSERMTSLFLKITNQMINTCKKYIREGYSKVWEIPRAELLNRINECKRLFQEYQKSFQKTREKLKSMENERQWDFRFNCAHRTLTQIPLKFTNFKRELYIREIRRVLQTSRQNRRRDKHN